MPPCMRWFSEYGQLRGAGILQQVATRPAPESLKHCLPVSPPKMKAHLVRDPVWRTCRMPSQTARSDWPPSMGATSGSSRSISCTATTSVPTVQATLKPGKARHSEARPRLDPPGLV